MTANIMQYKGYSARVEFDADDGLFFGRVAGVNDVVGFHADSVAKLVSAFHEVVDDYVTTRAKLVKSSERLPRTANID